MKGSDRRNKQKKGNEYKNGANCLVCKHSSSAHNKKREVVTYNPFQGKKVTIINFNCCSLCQCNCLV